MTKKYASKSLTSAPKRRVQEKRQPAKPDRQPPTHIELPADGFEEALAGWGPPGQSDPAARHERVRAWAQRALAAKLSGASWAIGMTLLTLDEDQPPHMSLKELAKLVGRPAGNLRKALEQLITHGLAVARPLPRRGRDIVLVASAAANPAALGRPKETIAIQTGEGHNEHHQADLITG